MKKDFLLLHKNLKQEFENIEITDVPNLTDEEAKIFFAYAVKAYNLGLAKEALAFYLNYIGGLYYGSLPEHQSMAEGRCGSSIGSVMVSKIAESLFYNKRRK